MLWEADFWRVNHWAKLLLEIVMKSIPLVKLDKRAFSVTSLRHESDERTYWLSKTPQERLQAVELLRQLNYGYDPTAARLQRVLTITELKTD
jgi:hypothetical protein